ncbi:MAG: HIT domain-containing protein [Candidatus Pacebacteria bacterium]|nr:HIT domain-containing protein [Candidatus Paceibacterota bacterium]
MENCIFDKIIKGEIPCTKVYEDENFLAFLDIQPVADGHLLLIPKKHMVWMQDADDETICGIFKLAKKLMLAIKKGIGCDYVQLSIVGKDVPHFHIHLIPRFLNDNLPMFRTKIYKDKESAEAAEKIIAAL